MLSQVVRRGSRLRVDPALALGALISANDTQIRARSASDGSSCRLKHHESFDWATIIQLMLRKTLTVLSLTGLLLSVRPWGVSYFKVEYVSSRRQTNS